MSEKKTINTITPLFSVEVIEKRISEIGKAISDDFDMVTQDCPLLLIVVLKGAFIFAADLLRTITIPCGIDFIHASSYGSEKTSSGSVSIKHNLSITDRHILLVEDIIDTGKTLSTFLPQLTRQQPASIKIATFLTKPTALKYDVKADYTAFEIEDKFVVGYGLDYDGLGRNLPDLYILK